MLRDRHSVCRPEETRVTYHVDRISVLATGTGVLTYRVLTDKQMAGKHSGQLAAAERSDDQAKPRRSPAPLPFLFIEEEGPFFNRRLCPWRRRCAARRSSVPS
jgi:hypothetical protein